jgi:integrase
MILKTAVRTRLIAVNPAGGVKIPAGGRGKVAPAAISPTDFFRNLLPAIPQRFRALVCTAAGAGLRWGECAELRWGDLDLERGRIRVVQVAVETPDAVALRPFPKSRAGRRTVPIPAFLVQALKQHRGDREPMADALVFPSRSGGPLRRNNFRRRVWLPSLARAGLLGANQTGDGSFKATWRGRDGKAQKANFANDREAVAQVARLAKGGLRFHDLRTRTRPGSSRKACPSTSSAR